MQTKETQEAQARLVLFDPAAGVWLHQRISDGTLILTTTTGQHAAGLTPEQAQPALGAALVSGLLRAGVIAQAGPRQPAGQCGRSGGGKVGAGCAKHSGGRR
jgi:hypothetical protein